MERTVERQEPRGEDAEGEGIRHEGRLAAWADEATLLTELREAEASLSGQRESYEVWWEAVGELGGGMVWRAGRKVLGEEMFRVVGGGGRGGGSG